MRSNSHIVIIIINNIPLFAMLTFDSRLVGVYLLPIHVLYESSIRQAIN